jgi:hypothetical protein
MPHLLFKLNGVPEDEAYEVHQLLDENHIDYYETTAGLFGISLAAIWLRDDGEVDRAHELLDNYQQQRYQQARETYEQQQRDGTAETFIQKALRSPLKTMIFFAVILAVLYFSIMPFINGL